MNISFYVHGLHFDATVEVSGYHLPATFWDPAEYPDVEITSLTQGGLDASFLLDSDELREKIESAAETAVLNYRPELEPA